MTEIKTSRLDEAVSLLRIAADVINEIPPRLHAAAANHNRRSAEIAQAIYDFLDAHDAVQPEPVQALVEVVSGYLYGDVTLVMLEAALDAHRDAQDAYRADQDVQP